MANGLVSAEAVRFALHSVLLDTDYLHQHIGGLQFDSRTEMLKQYGHVHCTRDVNVVMILQRLAIADTGGWRADTSTRQFFCDDAVGYSYNRWY